MSERYLHKRSYHSKHTFSGMVFSQFKRAALICSDITDRETHICRMENKFLNSGYKQEELSLHREKAMALDRRELLGGTSLPESKDSSKTVACVINQDPDVRHAINQFFREHSTDLQRLLGNVRLIVSERRHTNTSSLLFSKNGFSQNVKPLLNNQKCKSARCLTRATMNLPRQICVNHKLIHLDYHCDCSSDCVVYIAICKLCKEPIPTSNFYFGQTINTTMCRCNGHRDKFKLHKFDQSALSLHIMEEHEEYFHEKLNNFDFGVVKQVSAQNLNRCEDFYIWHTKADKDGLNRYKVSK